MGGAGVGESDLAGGAPPGGQDGTYCGASWMWTSVVVTVQWWEEKNAKIQKWAEKCETELGQDLEFKEEEH